MCLLEYTLARELKIYIQYCSEITENAFGTRLDRVPKCVPFAFHSCSICVPLLPKRNRKRVPVTVVVRSAIIEYHRDFRVLISVAFTLYSITKRAIEKLLDARKRIISLRSSLHFVIKTETKQTESVIFTFLFRQSVLMTCR